MGRRPSIDYTKLRRLIIMQLRASNDHGRPDNDKVQQPSAAFVKENGLEKGSLGAPRATASRRASQKWGEENEPSCDWQTRIPGQARSTLRKKY
jgi:hypothetical protein